LEIIQHPSVILIIGRRNRGKSALGFYILEIHHNENQLPCFVVGFPRSKQHLLPKWVTPIENIEDLPENCVALVDEASFKYHAHKVRGKETEYMDKMISVSRQKKQTIIFITHTMRKFAVTLLLDVDMLLCKEPSILHANLERAEVRKIMEEVKAAFSKVPPEDIQKCTYVVSDGYKGLIQNPLPSFWSEELSEAWAGVDLKPASEQTPPDVLEHYPLELVFKLWFKLTDKDKILDIIRCDGKRLDDSNVYCTKDRCHLHFEMKYVADGYYAPTSKRFNWDQIFHDLEEKKISYVLDTETSLVDGEFYPIPKDHLIFKTKEKEQGSDPYEKFAEDLKL